MSRWSIISWYKTLGSPSGSSLYSRVLSVEVEGCSPAGASSLRMGSIGGSVESAGAGCVEDVPGVAAGKSVDDDEAPG
eukprot:3540303-Pyramimonas_sp.AAC.1